MTCTGCGAPLRLEEEANCLTCDYCHGVHYPEPNDDGVRVLVERSEAACGVCERPLAVAALGGRRILYCEGCGGMLVEMRAFLALVGVLRSERGSFPVSPRPVDWRALDRRVRCPLCHGEMDTHPYGGPGNIVIDTCEACEVNWLDRGELARIVASPDRAYGCA